jgi:hypothetical protein
MSDGGFQKLACIDNVIAVIFCRIADGFAHIDAGGEVHDRVYAAGGKKIVQALPVRHVSDHMPAEAQEFGMTGGEVVENQHIMIRAFKGQRRMRADVARAADNENPFLHQQVLFLTSSQSDPILYPKTGKIKRGRTTGIHRIPSLMEGPSAGPPADARASFRTGFVSVRAEPRFRRGRQRKLAGRNFSLKSE